MSLFRSKPCKIVYRNEYLTAIHSRNSHQSFDPMRFRKIRDHLIHERLIKRKDVLRAEQVSDQDLLLVHTREYLNSLKNPAIVANILNLDYVDPWDNYVFEYFRYMVGGTLLATQYALDKNITVFNLGGGYHHAHPDRAEGFCMMNDVAIAIEKFKWRYKLDRVLIIDLDYHQGNGILKYYADNPNVFTFSMHGESWDRIDKENNIDIELPAHVEDEEYLDVLHSQLPNILGKFEPDLTIYLAGGDPYIQDAIGDFNLSEEGLLERDIFVYRQVRERKIPLVVLAAGGYGKESWKPYYFFIKWVMQNG